MRNEIGELDLFGYFDGNFRLFSLLFEHITLCFLFLEIDRRVALLVVAVIGLAFEEEFATDDEMSLFLAEMA